MTNAIEPWVEAHKNLSSEKGKASLESSLPSHLSYGTLINSFVTAINSDKTGKLRLCSSKSLVEGVKLAAQLGLSFSPALGQAYLVPFGREAQFIPGYKGLISLMYQSGIITKLVARSVHENDKFYYSYGLEEALEHEPANRNRGPCVASYAVVWLRYGGDPLFVVCTDDDLKKAQAASRRRGGPWETHRAEMARKTAIRQIANLLPKSAEDRASQALAQAVQIEDELEARALRSQGYTEPQADPWKVEQIEEDDMFLEDDPEEADSEAM